MAKPTGISGYFGVQVGADGKLIGGFEKVPFPEEQTGIEKRIVDRFLASANKRLAPNGDRFLFSDPEKNPENDFDFTVMSANGPAYLELMEVAPLSGPYSDAPASYKPYEFGKAILSGIMKKSTRYPKNLDRELFLLVYVTHWTFALSENVIACLRYWLGVQPTVFHAIFSYEPLDAEEGVPRWLSPSSPELLGSFDPEKIRDNICLNLDPRKGKIVCERKL